MHRHVHLPQERLVRLEYPEDIGVTPEVVQHQFDGAHHESGVRLEAYDGNQDREEALAYTRRRTSRQCCLLLREP